MTNSELLDTPVKVIIKPEESQLWREENRLVEISYDDKDDDDYLDVIDDCEERMLTSLN